MAILLNFVENIGLFLYLKLFYLKLFYQLGYFYFDWGPDITLSFT